MQIRLIQRRLYMPFSVILLVFKYSHDFFLQICKLTDLNVHISIVCPYFYGLSGKISDLLHLIIDFDVDINWTGVHHFHDNVRIIYLIQT